MLKKPLFWEMFFLLAVVGVLNYIATVNHLYWFVYEFDSAVHFLSGATLSAFFLWLYFFSGFFNPPNRDLKKFFFVSVLGVVLVAVSWEVYELFLGEAAVQKAEYAYDTSLDLIMDFLGAMAFCFYGYLKEVESKKASDFAKATPDKQNSS